MKFLITGPSGSGKTTFYKTVRQAYPNSFDLDIIGRWNKKTNEFVIAPNALKGLLIDFPQIICFGVSDNIKTLVPLFDKVVLIDQPYSSEHERSLLNREKERSLADGTSWRKNFEQKSRWLGKSKDWANDNGVIFNTTVVDQAELMKLLIDFGGTYGN